MAKIILRSSWQTVNIGDIGHTPGILQLLTKYLPEHEIVLWANDLDHGVYEMLSASFTEVSLYVSATDTEGLPTNADLRGHWDTADFFLHGSGPYLVAQDAVDGWVRHGRGRPFGVYGISLESPDPQTVALLSQARFVFFRDSQSLANARNSGVDSESMFFSPDATFAGVNPDFSAGDAYLYDYGLYDKPFLCAIPRLRYTPYFKMQNRQPTPREIEREEVSLAFRMVDHHKLRGVIESWIQGTGNWAFICPEMTYQIELGRSMLYDHLSEGMQAATLCRDTFWNPDEAAAIYARSSVVVSYEMHSPILALSVGTPAIYLRQPTDTCKGQMWRDIGLSDWILEIDECDERDISAAVDKIWSKPEWAESYVKLAQERIAELQAQSMSVLRREVSQLLSRY
ncbi:polysaccharide pyruvyl transferase family protein [Ruficoccus sp. ZRK36]|uniref:polysaccharide pyruvyl transferase family protein n=1 Tax=Ruficoccus sp. ZRK36 TaxID=2866311 RepID=UPI001C73AF2B|nr:polysaccharide pyruvyl transferase family protein [Ruficoccus sp. ZRK36]QYY36697.1 polysaccharide pyruvyl transferase family protein [Ruficoccus sp. ZRK36]